MVGITIGNDVWIGANVTILDGAVIHDGAVIAAGSVVRGEVAGGWVYGGVPARQLRPRMSGRPPFVMPTAADRQHQH